MKVHSICMCNYVNNSNRENSYCEQCNFCHSTLANGFARFDFAQTHLGLKRDNL